MEALQGFHISLENYLLFDKLIFTTKTYKNFNISFETPIANSAASIEIEATKRWTFPSSVLYSFTILTTIGIFDNFIN